jgi:AcrR family transcriptional regulator
MSTGAASELLSRPAGPAATVGSVTSRGNGGPVTKSDEPGQHLTSDGSAGIDMELNHVIDADAAIIAGSPPPSARTPLDRPRIVAAAIVFIDEHGLPGLTMRRLGTVLGVEAMSLYRYVPGKDDLLDGVVEALVAEMHVDDNVLRAPTNGWQDFMQRLAHGVRRIALAHPLAFPLVASRPPEAPWLRPPLRSLDWVEVFLSGLIAEGFDDDAAVAAYRAFSSFLLGHLLLEVSTHGADVGPLDVLEDTHDANEGLEKFPLVKKLRSQLSEDHAAVEFEEALEQLIERLTLIRSEHS